MKHSAAQHSTHSRDVALRLSGQAGGEAAPLHGTAGPQYSTASGVRVICVYVRVCIVCICVYLCARTMRQVRRGAEGALCMKRQVHYELAEVQCYEPFPPEKSYDQMPG